MSQRVFVGRTASRLCHAAVDVTPVAVRRSVVSLIHRDVQRWRGRTSRRASFAPAASLRRAPKTVKNTKVPNQRTLRSNRGDIFVM